VVDGAWGRLLRNVHEELTRIGVRLRLAVSLLPNNWRGRAPGCPVDGKILMVRTVSALGFHAPLDSFGPACHQGIVRLPTIREITSVGQKS
jgi:hypothetical protein